MSTYEKINSILDAISADAENRVEGVYINAVKNEFYKIHGEYTVPSIPVSEISFDEAAEIIENISGFLPQFLRGHRIFREKNPPADQHCIHLGKPLAGRLIDFVHILRLDMKFSGAPDNLVAAGNTEFYPSYRTDRVYFRSMLVPVKKGMNDIDSFSPARLVPEQKVESDLYFHTFAIFDEADTDTISKDLCQSAGSSLFSISPNIYPLISYAYFTGCLNVLEPDERSLDEAVHLYEPLFAFLHGLYTKSGMETGYPDEIETGPDGPRLKNEYKEKIKKITSARAIERDDELALKGLRRFAERKKI
jgi:hypothetical protein